MDKPDVDFIEGLSPAVSIDQKSTSRNPRSTVGTITEVYDYLRLLYARAGRPHCPVCGEPISRQSPAADRRPADGAARGHPVPGAGARGPWAARASTSRCSASSRTEGSARVPGDGEVVS
jgi:excinuclease ABC subunit A